VSLSVEDVAGELRALSACGSVDHFAEITLLLLWDLIPCDGVGFNDIDEARRRIEFFRSTDPDDASASRRRSSGATPTSSPSAGDFRRGVPVSSGPRTSSRNGPSDLHASMQTSCIRTEPSIR
jgi:hypothetical protein